MLRPLLRLFLLASLGLACGLAAAQSPATPIERGKAWLSARVAPDGTIAGEDAAIALPLQTRSETVLALDLFDLPATATVDLVQADTDDSVEFTARRAQVLAAAGRDASAPRAQLVAAQAEDGGFGLYAGFPGDPYDTAFALQALAGTGDTHATAVVAALQFLVASRNADGGWGFGPDSDVYVTAYVLSAAQAWADRHDVGATTGAARSWLLQQRQPDGRYGDVLYDALALIALSSQTADAAVLDPLVQGLAAAQAADGSWSGADPYVSALALRALGSAARTTPPQRAALTGLVADGGNGQPLPDVLVSLVGNAAFATTTGSDGRFTLAGLDAGPLQLRLGRLGYATRSVNATAVAGDEVDLGTVALTPAPLTASLSGVVRDSGGRLLKDATVTAGTENAITDAAGRYEITGIPAGNVPVAVMLDPYNTVQGSLILMPGERGVFSPTLYAGSTTPANATVRGTAVDAATQQPLAGVSVLLGASSVTTAANGRFEFMNRAAGEFALSLSANGRRTLNLKGLLARGINELGAQPLQTVATSSTLSGLVSDVDSGAPIAAAMLSIQGQSPTAASGPDGRYSLSGIAGTNFVVQVSAAGYLSRNVTVSLPEIGASTLNIELVPANGQGIFFDEVATDRPVYAPSREIEIEIGVRNASDTAAELIIDAEIIDANGIVVKLLKANSTGPGQNPPNLPISFPPGSRREIEMDWVTQRQAAGVYTVHARGSDSAGRVRAEGSATFTIDAGPMLSGAVVATPPLLQAGTVPVQLRASLANIGNRELPPGSAELSVILQALDPDGRTALSAAPEPFFDGAPLGSNARGLVRDDNGNLYTLETAARRVLRFDPQGVASVHAALPTGGSIALNALARDTAGNFWVGTSTKTLYRVSDQGNATTLQLNRLTRTAALTALASGELLLVGEYVGLDNGVSVDETRLVRRETNGTETVLWRNGFAQPFALVPDSAGNLYVTNYGDNTVARVARDGSITIFATGLNKPRGITRGSDGLLYVADSGSNSIVRIAADGTRSTFATGLNDPADLRFGSDGQLYVSTQGDDAIQRIAADGTASLFARGVVATPVALAYAADGALLSLNGDGTLRRLERDGRVVVQATGLDSPEALTVGGDGTIYVISGTRLLRIDGATATTLATGLSSPHGVAVDGTGNLHVTEGGTYRIATFAPDGRRLGAVESALQGPTTVVAEPGGRLFVLNADSVAVIDGGLPRKLSVAAFDALALDPPHGGLAAVRAKDVVRLDPTSGATALVKTLPLDAEDIAVDSAGDYVLRDAGAQRLYRLDAGGNFTTLVELPAQPYDLASDGSGKVYVLLSTGKVFEVARDGGLSEVRHGVSGAPSGLATTAAGRVLLWSSTVLYEIDPATGATTSLLTGLSSVNGAARDGSGRIITVGTSLERVSLYSAAGGLQSTVSGFRIPYGIVWTGSELRFVDSNDKLFGAAPGGYPQFLTTNFKADQLAQRGVDTVGVAVENSVSKVRAWNGTALRDLKQITNYLLGSIAVAADGGLAMAEKTNSRLLVLDAALNTSAEYAGLINPMGLVFDAQGRLLVANNGARSVVRLDRAGTAAQFIAASAQPRWLAFDASGKLWITRTDGIDTVAADGTRSELTGAPNAQGIVFLDGAPVVVEKEDAALLRFAAPLWTTLSAGIRAPSAIDVAANGDVYIGNRISGTIVRYANAHIEPVAQGLYNINAIDIGSEGRIAVARDSGLMNQVSTDGRVDLLRVKSQLGTTTISGVVDAGGGTLFAHNNGNLWRIRVTQAAEPPAPGTVVHRVTRPMAALPASADLAEIDFGSWTPAYGGDFKVEVRRGDVEGTPTNFVHVGAHASGELAASRSTLPPGDQTLAMCLGVSGAAANAISRVETGLARKLASISQPSGLIADRSGNLYYVDTSKLYKTTPAGVTSTLLTGLSLAKGLAIDDAENLYLLNKRGGNVVDVVKVDLAASRTTLATLDAAGVSGIAVNSRGEVLVAATDKLFKILADGSSSIVATRGLPGPQGITVDTADTVYVQNTNHLIAMIKPDGAVFDLYSAGDGTEEPTFEGDDNPTITADCGENLYLAPFRWTKVGQQGEEHVLTQINPRTRSVSMVFDALTVSPDLTDIDYLAFDRFSNRILIWNHTDEFIWQMPVTCGRIGARAHLVTAPGQSLTGMSKAPQAVVSLPGGRTEHVWSLNDIGPQGEAICFDTNLDDLQYGERRKTLDSGFLAFENSFAGQEIQVPIEVPLIDVTGLVQAQIATDLPEYAPNTTAAVTTRLQGGTTGETNGRLSVRVLDAQGVLVATLSAAGASVPADAEYRRDDSFPIGTRVPGEYRAVAELDAEGRVLARAETVFRVLADTAGSATSRVWTDKPVYRASEDAQIHSRAQNLSSNVVLNDLTLLVRVYDASNVEQYSFGHALRQLVPGALRDFRVLRPLDDVAPGDYRIVQQLLDSANRVLDQREATYRVGSPDDTGDGLGGTLEVAPASVVSGAAAQLQAAITNTGNADVDDLPVYLSVVDTAAQTVLWTWRGSVDAPRATPAAFVQDWIANAPAGSYTAVLGITAAGRDRVLAQKPLTVTAPTASVSLQQGLNAAARVLVLVRCEDANCVDDPVCTAGRVTQIDQLLSALGIEHAVVSTTDAFEQALRSGRYTTYWISGGAAPLAYRLADELREAVFRGDGLIVDGAHQARNAMLDPLLGVSFVEKLAANDVGVIVADGGIFASGSYLSRGAAQRYAATGALVQARFGDAASTPAAFRHTYGAGRTVVLAFDLPASLADTAQAAAWTDVLRRSLAHVAPPVGASPVGKAYVPLRTGVTNTGAALEVDVTLELPAGVQAETVRPAITSSTATSVTWRVALAAGETRVFDAGLRLPDADANRRLVTRVGRVVGSDVIALASRELVLPARSLADVAAAAIDAVETLAVTPPEQPARDQALASLRRAVQLHGQGRSDAAVAATLEASDRLA
ncbi:MAG TPA: carboxypeptidase regulatory-like domain-containing protein, partial [Tahibacter sp.]|uniref:carboxypeptidase regulatory-like domain-containing protein n=1 Tax=Tahibacter sp. TaxID=2056211 RepID=UPI002B71989B